MRIKPTRTLTSGVYGRVLRVCACFRLVIRIAIAAHFTFETRASFRVYCWPYAGDDAIGITDLSRWELELNFSLLVIGRNWNRLLTTYSSRGPWWVISSAQFTVFQSPGLVRHRAPRTAGISFQLDSRPEHRRVRADKHPRPFRLFGVYGRRLLHFLLPVGEPFCVNRTHVFVLFFFFLTSVGSLYVMRLVPDLIRPP